MREAYPDFQAAGANIVAVSAKSASVAKSMAPTLPFPLWLDADHKLRQAFELDTLSLAQVFGPKSALNYLKSASQARSLRVFPDEAMKTPVVVVLDADQNVAWKHIGKALGDYPAVSNILLHV